MYFSRVEIDSSLFPEVLGNVDADSVASVVEKMKNKHKDNRKCLIHGNLTSQNVNIQNDKPVVSL